MAADGAGAAARRIEDDGIEGAPGRPGDGIGEELRLSISRTHEAKTLAIVLLLLVTIIAVDQFSAWLRRKLVGDQAFAFGRGV